MNGLDISIITALALSITQVFKLAAQDERFNRFAPLISLLVGIGIATFFLGGNKDSLLLGIVSGLSASGLWSGGKSIAGN